QFGKLSYRSLEFKHQTLPVANYQGNAVVNYTSSKVPYTRIIEHKHFEFGTQNNTVITKEYPLQGSTSNEPYYPINNQENNSLYLKYKQLAQETPDVIFGGRLAE